jgi:hypothetical protein
VIVRRLLTVLGLGCFAFGVAGLLRHADETVPLDALKFLVGGLLLHDGILAPAVMVGGLLLARLVPRRYRPTVQGALVVSAALTLVAIPPLTGRGRLANNPSILPQDYGEGLLVALGVTWAIAALLLVRAAVRPEAPRPPEPPPLPEARPGW